MKKDAVDYAVAVKRGVMKLADVPAKMQGPVRAVKERDVIMRARAESSSRDNIMDRMAGRPHYLHG